MLALSCPYVHPILALGCPIVSANLPEVSQNTVNMSFFPFFGYQPKASGKGMDALVGLWGRRPDMLPLA